ncbi:hypothetical protein HMPREF9946_03155 [Acetobacteraceae bacterium AT-5844]|nr:hypothetical protein HMPREF9946_03155 [Acetobacteraceae bacterium AT-5844]
MSETLTYGLGPGGLVRMRLPEIRRSIFDELRARIGQPFDETPDSLSGQFVSIFSEREAALWELVQAVWLAAYPATATGLSLDYAVSYAGVTRIQPSRSSARVILIGAQGTTVPIGSIIESTYLPAGQAVPARFSTTADTVITRDDVAYLALRALNAPPTGTTYTVTYNGSTVSYTTVSGDTGTHVTLALKADIETLGGTAISNGQNLVITSQTTFQADWSATWTLTALGSPATAEALNTGPIEAPAESLTRIISVTPGWSAVRQPSAATLGTNLETDEELRARYATGVYRLGAGTVPSIRANLEQDIAGLASLAVYENTTNVTDADGRPPHSVEVVIEGGDDEAISAALYRLKPAGIRAYGNTLVPYTDDTGFQHQIAISRPEDQIVWLRATLTTTSEETVPGDVAARARRALVEAGSALGVGEDVFLQRIASAVFDATTGVAAVELEAVVSATTPAPGDYTSNDIAIGPRQRARFALDRTTVL